jgi:hypothetical protein
MHLDGERTWTISGRRQSLTKKDEEIFQGGPSLDECIDKLASSMKDKMKVSDGHKRMLENHLNNKFGQMIAKGPASS